MSFFVMGFQFMPSGSVLAPKEKQALTQYAQAITGTEKKAVSSQTDSKSQTRHEGLSLSLPWTKIKFSLPKVDFGFDELYGLGDQDSEDFAGKIVF